MFHARKWGWKRIATNLLLIPVLTGASAAVAPAQFNPVPPQTTAGAMPGKPAGDAKALLKEGRKALAAGQFDRAQDLARAAEASNSTGKWGLFDDTPNALLKDVQAAVLKAQKGQANQLVKQAKGLMSKPSANEAEKAANLDQALQMAQRADQLHGPYSAWDLGDRPDKLVKDIQTARGKLKTVPPANAPAPAPALPVAGGPAPAFLPPNAGGVMPAGGLTRTAPGAADPRKDAAVKLIAEGRKLAEQGMYPAARAKFMEADRLGAPFAANEYGPGFALSDLNTTGKQKIEQLVNDSRALMAKKEYVRAEANLTAAGEIAASLGLFTRPIDEAKTQLRTATSGKFGGATGSMGADAVAVAPVKPAAGTTGSTGSPTPKTVLPAAGTAVTGRQLLDQAVIEFKNGDLDMAAKLATSAHNQGLQDEARGLLNSIDAERLTQKKMTAVRSFDAAQSAIQRKDYNHAIGVLVLIDPNLLPPDMKGQRDELIGQCRTELAKTGTTTTVAAAATQQPGEPPVPGLGGSDEPPLTPGIPGVTPPGTARVGSDPKVSAPDSVAAQTDALRKVQVQKLRSDGLKILDEASKAFGRGETDLAIQMLVDYSNRVRTGSLDASSVAILLRPVESRLEMFRVMKGQADAQARIHKENRETKEMITGRGAAEEQRKTEVASLVRKYHTLVKAGNFAEAEKTAMVAKQLAPDDPAITALAEMAKISRRVKEAEQIKLEKERIFVDGMNASEKVGPFVDIDNPVKVHLEASMRASRRGADGGSYIRSRSPAEYDIEMKLDKPISIEFSQTPLEQAVENLKEKTGLPIVIDRASLDAEGLSAVKPITVNPGKAVATKHILTFTLEQAGLSYVVENDLVKVTSTRKAKGRLFTKVFSVADLVTPIPNFALPEYANFEKMMKGSAAMVNIGGAGGPTPLVPPGGLNNGQQASGMAGQLATQPGIAGGMPFGPGGRLDSQWQPTGPLSASAPVTGERNSKHEQLIRLITKMVRPYSWDEMGGPGRLEFFDIGSALVVNQTADVIKEVEELLEALRRLQDLALAVEIRIVSLSESWYERMGVDFSMNIKTHTASFEPALTQIDQGNPTNPASGVFRPTPFVNDINNKGVTVGLSPAGTFTPDLDVPIRPNTYNMAIPPFGGYPNTPGQNGGIALGLAFLNDIQVYMFMEAAAGDRRVNVMQAPKLTLFNGQTATLTVQDTQFFVANVQVLSVNGQIVFIPNNSPFPAGTSYSITIQGVVSADRRFVRLNLPVTLTAQAGTSVPLFPFTTFVIPTFEGGSQGQPVPFTQFLQQPGFTTINANTTVVCPDGGTVLLGGLKTLSEGRNEFGPPVLSKIPYLNRLFKNVGIGRETRHIMIMVTPRIIINSEEEIFQTEGRPPTTPQ